MTHEMTNDIAKILGVDADSITQLPEDILGSMQTILENVEVRVFVLRHFEPVQEC